MNMPIRRILGSPYRNSVPARSKIVVWPVRILIIPKPTNDMEGVSKYSGQEASASDSTPSRSSSNVRARAFTGFGVSLILVLLFVLFFYFNFTTVIVSGPSMLPTLSSGKKVLVSRAYWLVGPIQDGNVIVIRQSEGPDGYIIKRVYKQAGETVDTLNAPSSWSLDRGPFSVPDGDVYVLGDNRSVSEDSRRFGPLPASAILGKVVAY